MVAKNFSSVLAGIVQRLVMFFKSKPGAYLAGLSICLLLLFRFYALEADPPATISWSAALLTDEGIYSVNSSAFMLDNDWYLEGGYNSAITLPVVPCLQIGLFMLNGGVSLWVVRLISLLFFFLLIGFTMLLLKQHCGRQTALLCGLLLVSNHFLYAYSRLALLEVPMTFFLLLAVYLLLRNIGELSWKSLSAVAIVVFIAMLTKTSALFIFGLFPVIFFFAPLPLGEKIKKMFFLYGFIFILLILYYLLIWHFYPEDFKCFIDTVIRSRTRFDIVRFCANLGNAIVGGSSVDFLLFPLSLLLGVFSVVSRELRSKPIVWVCVAWIVFSLMQLALNGYTPPRYYVPMAVPCLILISIWLTHPYRKPILRLLQVLILFIVIIASINNMRKLSNRLLKAEYSVRDMAVSVKNIIAQEGKKGAVLLGSCADTVRLLTGIKSLNENFGTLGLEEKFKLYKPNYYLQSGNMTKGDRLLFAKYFKLKELKKYTVLHDWLGGKPVRLYSLSWLAGSDANK